MYNNIMLVIKIFQFNFVQRISFIAETKLVLKKICKNFEAVLLMQLLKEDKLKKV